MVFYGLLDNLCASLDAYVCDDGYVCHDTYIVVMVFVVRMILIYVVYVYFIIYICREFELKSNRKKGKKFGRKLCLRLSRRHRVTMSYQRTTRGAYAYS